MCGIMWSQHTYPYYAHTLYMYIGQFSHTHTHTHTIISVAASRRGAGGGGGKIGAAHETDAESCGRTAVPPPPRDEPINQSGLCADNINNMHWSFAVTRFSEYPYGMGPSPDLEMEHMRRSLCQSDAAGYPPALHHCVRTQCNVHYTRMPASMCALCPRVSTYYLGRGRNSVYAFDEQDMSVREKIYDGRVRSLYRYNTPCTIYTYMRVRVGGRLRVRGRVGLPLSRDVV